MATLTKLTSEQTKAIAGTILKQVGGVGRLVAMIGAKQFVHGQDAKGNPEVTVIFSCRGAKANAFKITLNGLDLYDLVVTKIHGTKLKEVANHSNLYAEDLKGALEKATGLYISL